MAMRRRLWTLLLVSFAGASVAAGDAPGPKEHGSAEAGRASTPTGAAGASAPGARRAAAGADAEWPFDAREAKRRQEETARRLGIPVDRGIDLGKGARMRLVLVPAGRFVMGSPARERSRSRNEGPQREVAITRPFYMGRCEVTRGQFAAFVADAGYKTEPEREGWAFAWDGRKWDKIRGASWKEVGFDQTDAHPVVCVSWGDARAFCAWLSRRTGHAARLPTEAEWEYACRAGTQTAYCWGGDRADGKGWCNAADLTGRRRFRCWSAFGWEDGHVFTAPVGTYQANAFGLYDMHGNVWEWCSDWYGRYSAKAPSADPQGAGSGTLRVVRGGSWLSDPSRCRSAFRTGSRPLGFYCDFIVGFRVVLEPKAAKVPRSP